MKVSKSAKYYAENPEAREVKKKYDTKYHATEERIKYRTFLNKKNRDAGTYGNGDDLDYDHDDVSTDLYSHPRHNSSKY